MAVNEGISNSKGIIQYSSRDYENIMADFWAAVKVLTDLWSPEADADPGVVLGKILASTADMLGVNLDWLANEIYGPTVTQRKNAEKLFALCGYTLGWYTAARTEVTFTNTSGSAISFNFGFNGGNFSTVNAYTDITNESRVITYNILPNTNSFGKKDTRSKRLILTESADVFAEDDKVTLQNGESVTRVAIEGELRSVSVSVKDIIKNNYIVKLPSQHLDTSAIWVKAKDGSGGAVKTQWVQVASAAEFVTPEPRFAVTYDSYSNAQVQISNYLNQLENYADNYLIIYWIDCSGVIGCVGKDVLTNFLQAQVTYLPDGTPLTPPSEDAGEFEISNLSNTVELPHTYTVTGKSPETAKEAYFNSRNYINTHDSLITLPDFNRFLNREPGVDCGLVLDCQKALEINLAIYNDENLTKEQKSKMYITYKDFAESNDDIFEWTNILNLGFDPTNPNKFVFAANFKRYTAMCFAIHNDFHDSDYGQGQISNIQVNNRAKFIQYKPPQLFIDNVVNDYLPLQAMSVQLEFGNLRIFNWYVQGIIYPTRPVSQTVADNIVAKVKEDLALFFSPANRRIGQKPTVMEVVNVVRNAHSLIDYFDAGTLKNPVINWKGCDIECFNPISFARYSDPGESATNIQVAPEYIAK